MLHTRTRAAALSLAAALAGAITLTAAHADTPDTQAPTLASYRVLPSTVDDTAAPTTVTVVVRIRDAAQAGATATGFSNGTVTLASSTNTLEAVGFTDSDRISGTPFDGTYDVDIPIEQGTPAGSYTPSIYLEDFAGAHATVTDPTALTVTRATDTTAPALVGLTASASSVDVTAGDRSVTFTAHITDAQSGAAAVRLALAGPSSESDVLDFDRTSGTARDGYWTATELFSSYGSPGRWSATGLTLTDAFGNATTVTTGLGAAAITVQATVDTTKPTLSGVTLDRTAVDVTDGPKTVRVTVRAGDDASGISTGHVTFTGDDGYSEADADLSAAPVTGTTIDGSWTADVSFDTAGRFTLSEVDLVDAQGNELSLCTPAAPADSFDDAPDSGCDGPQPAAVVTVTATDDEVGPVATNFTIGPATSTAGYQGAARIDGSFTVTDATSGFGGAKVTLARTTGGTATTYAFASPDDLVSGTPHNGTVHFSTYLDASLAGTWTLQSLEVDDVVGNPTTYTTGLGSVTVVTTRNDTAAPTLTGFAVTPNPVTTTAGARPVTISANVTDAQTGAVPSGVADVTVTLASPTGTRTDVDLDTLVAGNAVTGTWSGTTTIGQYADAGTWTVVSAAVTDAAGLVRNYPGDATLPAGGSFVVASAVDTTAPIITGVSVPSAMVDATGADRGGVTIPVHIRGTDTGAGIDDVAVTLTGPGGQQRSATIPLDNTLAVDTDVLVTVPSFSAGGTWSVSEVDLLCDHGPDTRSTSSDLAQHASFVLIEPADTAGPDVTGVTITPSPVDTSAAPVEADVLVHLRDAGSGVDHGWLTLTSPHGYQTLSTGLTLEAGDAGDGWWQGSIRLPRYVDGGAWRVSVSAADALGNGTDATAATNSAVPATVTVTGLTDATAPRLTNLTLNHASLDAAALSSGGWLTVATTAQDDDSGVAAVEVTLTAPNGAMQTVAGGPVAASTPTNASYLAAVPLASLLQVGTWRVSSVVVRDLTGNAATYDSTQLGAWASTFTVSSVPGSTPSTTSPPPVPTNVTAILAAGTATVSWTAPSGPVTAYTVTPYRDGSPQATVGTSTNSLTVTGLAKGAAYTFVVRAYSTGGASDPSVPSITLLVPATVPAAPSVGMVSLVGTTATVAFIPPTDDGGATVTSYSVTPWSDGTPGTAVHVAASALSATITGLQRGQSYSFTVAAANNKGWSQPSPSSDAVQVPAVPPTSTPPRDPASDRVATSLTVTSMSTSLIYGSTLGVTGRLIRSDTSAPLVGRTVRLQYRRHGVGAYATLATVGRTTTAGIVTFRGFRPGYSVDVRLVFAGATEQGSTALIAATSAARVATQHARVTAATSATRVRRGKTFVVSGSVGPNKRGRPIVLQRRSGSRWVTLASQALSAASGYHFTVRASSRGAFSYRAYYAADGYQAGTTSATTTVRVT